LDLLTLRLGASRSRWKYKKVRNGLLIIDFLKRRNEMLSFLTLLDSFKSKGAQRSNSNGHGLIDNWISSIKKCKTQTARWVTHILSLTQHLMHQSHFIPWSAQQLHLDSSEISFIKFGGKYIDRGRVSRVTWSQLTNRPGDQLH